MTFSLSRWQDSGIIVVRGEGSCSVGESTEALRALEHQTIVPNLCAILLDLRSFDTIPSSDEARQLAGSFGAFCISHGCRIAYVAAAGAPYGMARMVEMLSQQQGVMAAAFTAPEPALRWLEGETRTLGV